MSHRPPTQLIDTCGAEFSECRTYRYALWRHWDWQGHANCVAFVGLNPSTADETIDDPTIRRCIGFAKAWNFGGLYMLNAYAFRATDPKDMKAASDPIGPGNNEALSYYRTRVSCVIAAWGVHCDPARAKEVCDILRRPVYCLGKTKSGAPKHPLYLAANTERILFDAT